MQYEKIKITDIVPAEYNPRQISETEKQKLKNSLKEFGLVDPIVINLQNNHIIGGHQRFDAILDQYMLDGEFLSELNLIRLGDIGWVFTDTDLTVKSLEHEKALNIALNKISGEWDPEKLEEIFDDLNVNGFNVTLTGFDNLEITNLNTTTTTDLDEYKPVGDLISKYTDENDTSEHGSLKRDYIQPPFSILKANTKDWLSLKKELRTEIGDNGESREEALGEGFGVSIFDPVLALIILTWFTPKGTSNVVDCFSGDSIIGAMSSRLGNNFTGIELRQEQVDLNNSRLKNTTSKYICDDGCNILKHVPENTQDLLFSCPPYFDLEVYSDLPNDASNQESYEDFINILDTAFTNSIKTLKDNRFAVIVAGDVRDKKGFYYPFTDDIKKIFRKAGMGLYNDIILADPIGSSALRARNTFKNRKVVKVHQNVMCFFKGDPSKVKDEFILECEENTGVDD